MKAKMTALASAFAVAFALSASGASAQSVAGDVRITPVQFGFGVEMAPVHPYWGDEDARWRREEWRRRQWERRRAWERRREWERRHRGWDDDEY